MAREWSTRWSRLSRWAALPFLVLLVSCGVLLVSCGDLDGASNADAAVPGSVGLAPPVSATTASGPDAPAAPAPADATVTGAPAGARCTNGDLVVSLGSVTPVGQGQHRLPVILTNRSTWPCSLKGFAGVMLYAADGSGYDLPRSSSVAPSRLVLQPGAATHAILTYLSSAQGDADVFTPTHLLVTPPGSVNPIPVIWPHGSVVDQQATARAGTFVAAVAYGTGGG